MRRAQVFHSMTTHAPAGPDVRDDFGTRRRQRTILHAAAFVLGFSLIFIVG